MLKTYKVCFFVILFLLVASCVPTHINNPFKDALIQGDNLKKAKDSSTGKLHNYVGSGKCVECHYRIVWDWGYTIHGEPFYNLKTKGDLGCQSCHTRGDFNLERISSSSPFFIIQCECCHGPGKYHMQIPSPENINIKNEKVCVFCHTQLDIPDSMHQRCIQGIFHDLFYSKNRILEGEFRAYKQNTDEVSKALKRENSIECAYDADCIARDKIGICSYPDTEQSRCKFFDIETIHVTVIYDEVNPLLSPSGYIQYLMRTGNKIKPVYISYDTKEGIQYIAEFGIKTLPYIILDSDIRKSVFFPQISRHLKKIQDKYTLSDRLINPRYLLPGELQPKKLEVFFHIDDLEGIQDILPFLEDFNNSDISIKYSIYYPSRYAKAAHVLHPNRLKPTSTDGEYRLESTLISQGNQEKDKEFSTDDQYALKQVNISFMDIEDKTHRRDYWEEVLRQGCIIRYFSERYTDYLKDCRTKKGDNPDTFLDTLSQEERDILKDCISSPETEEALTNDMRRIKAYEIDQFPAFLLNNKMLITGSNKTKELFDLFF